MHCASKVCGFQQPSSHHSLTNPPNIFLVIADGDYEYDDDDDDDDHGNADAASASATDVRLIPPDDAVMLEIAYVRPIRERHDAVRALGFAWETAGLRDGSGVAVVCAVSGVGLCSPRYAEATAAGLRPTADTPPPSVERADVILRMNKVVLSEEDAILLPALLSKAAELDRLTLRVLRTRPEAIESVIEHGLSAAMSARVDSVICAELAAALESESAAAPVSSTHARDPPLHFAAALADAVGLGSLSSSPDVSSWAKGRSFERAKAHALLSRELVHKLNESRGSGATASASRQPHESTNVWLALAAFGAGSDDAADLCRVALRTNVGKRRQRELLPALSRALAAKGDLTGASEQLWLEAAAAEAEQDHAVVLRCMFDVAVLADRTATATAGGGFVAALSPLPPAVADTYRQALAAGAMCAPGTLTRPQRRWIAAAATRLGEPVPQGCEGMSEGGLCVIT